LFLRRSLLFVQARYTNLRNWSALSPALFIWNLCGGQAALGAPQCGASGADNKLLIGWQLRPVAVHKFLPQLCSLTTLDRQREIFTIFSFSMLARASMAPGDFPHRGLCFCRIGSSEAPIGPQRYSLRTTSS
jgi:hypothetical protein